jgi:hypothetical protein
MGKSKQEFVQMVSKNKISAKACPAEIYCRWLKPNGNENAGSG